MKIRILPNAETDFELGADFYESQRAGLGEYFVTSLISDVESLKLHGGIHEQYRGFIGLSPNDFPLRSTIDYGTIQSRFTPYWIAAKIRKA